VTASSSAYGNAIMFTGRQYDSETGNYYYRARIYDPLRGRFTSPDPLQYVDGMNLYHAYFVLYAVDPTGRSTRTEYRRVGVPTLEYVYHKVLWEEKAVPVFTLFFEDLTFYRHKSVYEEVNYEVAALTRNEVSIAGPTTAGGYDVAPLVIWYSFGYVQPNKWIVVDNLRNAKGVWTGRGKSCRKLVRCKQKCQEVTVMGDAIMLKNRDFEVSWVPRGKEVWDKKKKSLSIEPGKKRLYVYGTLDWPNLSGIPLCMTTGSEEEWAALLCTKPCPCQK